MKARIIEECLRISRRQLFKHPKIKYSGSLHYSFVVQSGKVVEWGMNREGKPPSFLGFDKHSKLHAEVVAYRKARGLLDKLVPFQLINVRINRSGELRNSYPCPCCLGYLETLNCSEVWFSTNAGMAKMRIGG